jgi:hypothetical protein
MSLIDKLKECLPVQHRKNNHERDHAQERGVTTWLPRNGEDQ